MSQRRHASCLPRVDRRRERAMNSTEAIRESIREDIAHLVRQDVVVEVDDVIHGATFDGRRLVVAAGELFARLIPDSGRVVDQLETFPIEVGSPTPSDISGSKRGSPPAARSANGLRAADQSRPSWATSRGWNASATMSWCFTRPAARSRAWRPWTLPWSRASRPARRCGVSPGSVASSGPPRRTSSVASTLPRGESSRASRCLPASRSATSRATRRAASGASTAAARSCARSASRARLNLI